MATKKTTQALKPKLTTAQQLGSIIKSARDIMRKDKGLNGDGVDFLHGFEFDIPSMA